MFVTDKLLIRVFVLCCLLVPKIALSASAPTHCLVDDAVVPYDSYCKGSDVLIKADFKLDRFMIKGDAKKVINAGLSFCSQQEFKPDSLDYTYDYKGGMIFDSILTAWCSFSEQTQLTQLGLNQLQIRKILLPPSKVFANLSAWMEFRQPNQSLRVIPNLVGLGQYPYVQPELSEMKRRKEDGARLGLSYSLKTLSSYFFIKLPFDKQLLLKVQVDITPTPPKLNTDSEGFWLVTPAITKGKEGSDTIIRMRITRGNQLITEPKIYSKLFKEISDTAFVESIDFEPFTIE